MFQCGDKTRYLKTDKILVSLGKKTVAFKFWILLFSRRLRNSVVVVLVVVGTILKIRATLNCLLCRRRFSNILERRTIYTIYIYISLQWCVLCYWMKPLRRSEWKSSNWVQHLRSSGGCCHNCSAQWGNRVSNCQSGPWTNFRHFHSSVRDIFLNCMQKHCQASENFLSRVFCR